MPRRIHLCLAGQYGAFRLTSQARRRHSLSDLTRPFPRSVISQVQVAQKHTLESCMQIMTTGASRPTQFRRNASRTLAFATTPLPHRWPARDADSRGARCIGVRSSEAQVSTLMVPCKHMRHCAYLVRARWTQSSIGGRDGCKEGVHAMIVQPVTLPMHSVTSDSMHGDVLYGMLGEKGRVSGQELNDADARHHPNIFRFSKFVLVYRSSTPLLDI